MVLGLVDWVILLFGVCMFFLSGALDSMHTNFILILLSVVMMNCPEIHLRLWYVFLNCST